jgi:hypothetical protein
MCRVETIKNERKEMEAMMYLTNIIFRTLFRTPAFSAIALILLSCNDLDSSDKDSSVIAGYFRDTVTFGIGDPTETTSILPYGNYNLFIAGYSANGALDWIQIPTPPAWSDSLAAAFASLTILSLLWEGLRTA